MYSDGALKLWIDGEEAPASLEMTNVPQISGLYEEYEFEVAQEQVLDMERDINLKRMISINYGDYAWGALCDRVKWAETDGREKGSVATVNYNRGGLYENIEYFDRSSYAPTDQFILSGLAEGEARVTVEHALTGDSAALDLSVKPWPASSTCSSATPADHHPHLYQRQGGAQDREERGRRPRRHL